MSRIALVLLPFVLACPVFGQENGSTAGAWFEKIKGLEGEWVHLGEDAASPEDDVHITYRVTAAGNAVIETVFAGTPHEMVTLYHLEGKDLALTHYCAIGNRPHLRGEPGEDGKSIVFECTGPTPGMAEEDHHMHSLVMTFVDADHLQTKWTAHEGGKPGHVVEFDLKAMSH